jgi:Clp amino terminal domain, pathogenicity island component
MSLARARGERLGAEHLLIALLDQGTPEVAGALSRAPLEPAAVRRAALAAIGAAAGEPRITLPALTLAGTMDRPPLPVADLDVRAWAALRWRRTVSSSAATSRAIAGTGVPDADAIMIIARRTRTEPCFPRRTICCSRCPS